ncbi:MAG: hypothetical protein ACYDG2_06080 [Ruminiclostridium sp.]
MENLTENNIFVARIDDEYERRGHLIGRTTLAAGFLASMLLPIVLWLVFGVIPPIDKLLKGIFSISVIMLPVSIVEVITFSPIMGSSAMYLSYLTGNISNLKLPCAAMALDAVDVKPSTREGDVISTIAITGSVVSSTLVVLAGVLLLVPLSGQLNNPVLKPAFEQILPALFGALGAYYILKEWKLAVAPLALAILINLFGGLDSALLIPLCVLISVLSARFLYKKNLVKAVDSID